MINELVKNNHRPLLIVCSGPSSSSVDYSRMPENPVIFRMNLFPLEDDYYFGKKVDAVFWSVHRAVVQDELYRTILNGEYEIKAFFSPVKLADKAHRDRLEIDKKHDSAFRPRYDHWNIMASEPEIAREMMARPLPTQGLQTLVTALILGFKEIHITGMDFYQSTEKRYAFEIPDRIITNASPVHFKPGYEEKAHSINRDLRFLSLLKNKYPDAKIFSLSSQSFLSSLTGLSPIKASPNNLFLKKERAGNSGGKIEMGKLEKGFLSIFFKKFIVPFIIRSIGSFFKTPLGKRCLRRLRLLANDINQML